MVAAVFNVFDGLELLPYSVSNIEPCVEGIIFVYQDKSNYGEVMNVGETVYELALKSKVRTGIVKYEPNFSISPADNERNKREIGRKTAERMGFTHFIDMDCDEFYLQDEFLKAKDYIFSWDLNGLVCKSVVYFGSPTLTIGEDITLVPFIHKINCRHEFNKKYPFAFDKTIRIDPTRQLSFTLGVEMSEFYMHHYSWVRKDYGLKIRNSSARANIQRSTILNDLVHADDGYYCEFYKAQLKRCPNVFGITWQREQDKTNPDISPISGGNPLKPLTNKP